ncbi:MAG: hypothetical protein U1F43_03005 [Myxococcota bacterium]
MADSAKPNGKLTTGAVGGFLLAGSFILMFVSGGVAMAGGGGADGAGGGGFLGLISFILMLAGGITHAMGFFGLGSIYGGTNGIAGVFSIILGIAPVLAILLPILGGLSMLKISMIVLFGSAGLAGVLGGGGLMAAKSALAKPAGIVLLVGGIGALGLLLGMFGILPLSILAIFGYVGILGLAAGFLLSGITMLGERG